jgi:hypothetical protein
MLDLLPHDVVDAISGELRLLSKRQLRRLDWWVRQVLKRRECGVEELLDEIDFLKAEQ